MVTADGRLVTRDLPRALLAGVTRASVMELARARGMTVEERAYSPEQALQAREAFITSATNFVVPVVKIDDATIGDGTPGEFAKGLRNHYVETRRAMAI
ncbi:aminotransferase class IV [Tropicimonas sp. IMCC6043]|uniref:aminotransferase class IV n=1 Tax=Tropicimonas sp. IMCC6043 TaxID=2510645 RepID=UPI00210FD193|nr:aminotransferase class IV [Tropicimonas sp. IMCC6043]